MASGLQLYNSAGQLVLDTSTLLPRAVEIGLQTSAGSASIPAIQQGLNVGVPQVVSSNTVPPPVVTLEGATLSWRPRENSGGQMNAQIRVVLL